MNRISMAFILLLSSVALAQTEEKVDIHYILNKFAASESILVEEPNLCSVSINKKSNSVQLIAKSKGRTDILEVKNEDLFTKTIKGIGEIFDLSFPGGQMRITTMSHSEQVYYFSYALGDKPGACSNAIYGPKEELQLSFSLETRYQLIDAISQKIRAILGDHYTKGNLSAVRDGVASYDLIGDTAHGGWHNCVKISGAGKRHERLKKQLADDLTNLSVTLKRENPHLKLNITSSIVETCEID